MTAKERAQLIFNAAQMDNSDVYVLRNGSKIALATALVLEGRAIGVIPAGSGFEAMDVTGFDVFRCDPVLLCPAETPDGADAQ